MKKNLFFSLVFFILILTCPISAIGATATKEWKTYSDTRMIFAYPDTYVVEYSQEEAHEQISCEIISDDIIASFAIGFTHIPEINKISAEEIKTIIENTIDATANAAFSYYSSSKLYELEQTSKIGLNGYSKDYKAEIDGWDIKGEIFVAHSGEYIVLLMTTAESEKELNDINTIINTIRFK